MTGSAIFRNADPQQRRWPTLVVVRIACALAGVLAAVPARAQLCGPTDDPCVVSASINVPSGSVFNLGTRDLVIAANKTLTVQGAGLLSVTAGDILLDDGARIVATGNTGVGGDITLTASGTITLDIAILEWWKPSSASPKI